MFNFISPYSVDAFDNGIAGVSRYANDDWTKPNTRVVKEIVDGKPRLFLKSIRKIMQGCELRYDYNDPRAPWRCESNPVCNVHKVYISFIKIK